MRTSRSSLPSRTMFADDPMAGVEHREEAERSGIGSTASRSLRCTADAPPDDHKFRGRRGRVQCLRPLPRPAAVVKTGKTSQRKFQVGLLHRAEHPVSNGQQHPVVIFTTLPETRFRHRPSGNSSITRLRRMGWIQTLSRPVSPSPEEFINETLFTVPVDLAAERQNSAHAPRSIRRIRFTEY